MIIYASQDGIGNRFKDVSKWTWFLTKIFFGNMGYSSSYCATNYIDWTKSNEGVDLHFSCSPTTKITKVIYAGIGSADPYPDKDSYMKDLFEMNRCFFNPESEEDVEKLPWMTSFDTE